MFLSSTQSPELTKIQPSGGRIDSADEISGQDRSTGNASVVEPLRKTKLADVRTEPTEMPGTDDLIDEGLSKLVYHTTTKDDSSQVQERCGVSDRKRKRVHSIHHQLCRYLVALVEGSSEVPGLDGSGARQVHECGASAGIGERSGSSLEPSSPCVGLQMPAPATTAGLTAGANGHMADFPNHAPTTLSDRAVEDQASTDTGSNKDREKIIDALPGAKAMLGQGTAVDIVPNRDGEVDRFLEPGLQVDRLIPARDVCAPDDGAMVDDKSGHADPDSGCPFSTLEVLDGGHDRFDHIVRTGLGRRHLAPPDGAAGCRVDEAGQNLRSAKIDADVAWQ